MMMKEDEEKCPQQQEEGVDSGINLDRERIFSSNSKAFHSKMMDLLSPVDLIGISMGNGQNAPIFSQSKKYCNYLGKTATDGSMQGIEKGKLPDAMRRPTHRSAIHSYHTTYTVSFSDFLR
jgi:hypothetical protein